MITLGLLCACARDKPPPADLATPSPSIPSFTNLHARVVWCQDIGDGTDLAAHSDQLLLMGYDTRDGQGERVVLSAPGNYAKPSLTPTGDRIVFSNRKSGQVYVVNWDGSGFHRIGKGFALATWRHPQSGREYVYAGTDRILLKAPSYRSVTRWPIDDPSKREIVWSRSIISEDFQPSADGRLGCSAFPWPACGIAQLPNGPWQAFGQGCWPSLAPGNTPLMWIFDGQHKNLYMYDLNGIHQWWMIPLSSADEFDGYEVYHPRWSNHPRFMALTGPYSSGDGPSRIMAGGTNVEIFVGQFSKDFRQIEHLARITRNARADYYPDVWIDFEHQGTPALRVKALSLPDDGPHSCWPGFRQHLNFARDGSNTLTHGMGDLANEPFMIGELSLEVLITPEHDNAKRFASIVTYGSDLSTSFLLGQLDDDLIFRLRTSAGPADPPDIALCRLQRGRPNHIVVSYSPGRLVCYLNGNPVFSTDDVQGDFRDWTPGNLVLSDSPKGAANWRGQLSAIAVYHRWMTKEEAALNHTLLTKTP